MSKSCNVNKKEPYLCKLWKARSTKLPITNNIKDLKTSRVEWEQRPGEEQRLVGHWRVARWLRPGELSRTAGWIHTTHTATSSHHQPPSHSQCCQAALLSYLQWTNRVPLHYWASIFGKDNSIPQRAPYQAPHRWYSLILLLTHFGATCWSGWSVPPSTSLIGL